MAKNKKLPPPETATLSQAIVEIGRLAHWASRLGYVDIAPRLEWVAEVLKGYETTASPDKWIDP